MREELRAEDMREEREEEPEQAYFCARIAVSMSMNDAIRA
jgi:hypothetical protein